MAEVALDLEAKQCLIDFFDDPNQLRWHHRLLLVPSTANDSRWIACSPDLDLEVLDLSDHRVIPLQRGQAFPNDRLHEIYAFDEFNAGEYEELQRRAKELANLLGFGAPARAAGMGVWRVADTTAPSFGEEVPPEALADEETCVFRDDRGLIQIDESWTYMELVQDKDVETWMRDRLSTGSLDPRILQVKRDARGKRHRTEVESMDDWKNLKESDFPLRGPKAMLEWFESLSAAGQTLTQHHHDFVAKAGLAAKGSIAREHSALAEALRFFVSHDQVDPTMLVGCEMLVRRLIMIETAVNRNPKTPDWGGLDAMLSQRISETGTAVTVGFNTWLSEVQRTDAQILKQGRLLREEKEMAAKNTKAAGAKGAAADP